MGGKREVGRGREAMRMSLLQLSGLQGGPLLPPSRAQSPNICCCYLWNVFKSQTREDSPALSNQEVLCRVHYPKAHTEEILNYLPLLPDYCTQIATVTERQLECLDS